MADETKEQPKKQKGLLESLDKDYSQRLNKIVGTQYKPAAWIGLIIDLTPCKTPIEKLVEEDLTPTHKAKLKAICTELKISEEDWIKKLIDQNCPNIPAVKS